MIVPGLQNVRSPSRLNAGHPIARQLLTCLHVVPGSNGYGTQWLRDISPQRLDGELSNWEVGDWQGSHLALDGINEGLATRSLLQATTAHTFAAKIRLKANAEAIIMHRQSAASFHQLGMRFSSSAGWNLGNPEAGRRLAAFVFSDDRTWKHGNADLDLNRWYSICAVFGYWSAGSHPSIDLYVDGSPIAVTSDNGSAPQSIAATVPITVGHGNGISYSQVDIAWCGMWRRPLLPSEVLELHRSSGRVLWGSIGHTRWLSGSAVAPRITRSNLVWAAP